MRLKFVTMYAAMSARRLVRHRAAMVLLLVIPTLFCTIIMLITPDRTTVLELPAVDDAAVLQVNERDETIVFIGCAVVCLLTALFALHLVQRQWAVDRRLVVAGYSSTELLAAKLAVLGGVMLLTSLYVCGLVSLYVDLDRWWYAIAGFLTGGLVYGCYGLLVGSVVRRELEGVLSVILLSNIDVAWLQNPIIYAGAEHKAAIRLLPGFYPVQVTMTGTFTDHSVLSPTLLALLYGAFFLAFVLLVYALRMRVGPRGRRGKIRRWVSGEPVGSKGG